MAGIFDLREDMDDSSFCQQKPYSCTAGFTVNMVGGVN